VDTHTQSQIENFSLLENIAAVSGEVHSDEKQYSDFYYLYSLQLSGFPGIWHFCAVAGLAFTQVEIEQKREWDGEWIDAITNYVSAILTQAIDNPGTDVEDIDFLKRHAREAIKRAEEEHFGTDKATT
jgi:hypothetical protein